MGFGYCLGDWIVEGFGGCFGGVLYIGVVFLEFLRTDEAGLIELQHRGVFLDISGYFSQKNLRVRPVWEI